MFHILFLHRIVHLQQIYDFIFFLFEVVEQVQSEAITIFGASK